jgi:pimeloyl-ACP methyl ester carboxylesterase
VDTFLAQEWVGVALAAPVALLGWAIFKRCRAVSGRRARLAARTVSAGIAGIATLLTVGSVAHLIQIARDACAFPPRGKLVDIGGYRMHLLAEGANAVTQHGRMPTVVLIPGGYAQGLGMYHLHSRVRSRTRSIIYDHAGTGWSDLGPFPRTPIREADELKRLLERAGEKGPFVLVGHSFGGLLANNFAARYPRAVAGLVLFDPTPIASSETSRGSLRVRSAGLVMRATGLAHGFGLSFAFSSAGGFVVPAAYKDALETQLQRLGELRAAFEARERRVQSNIAAASMIGTFFTEPTSDLVQQPGSLGELPMTVVYSKAALALSQQAAREVQALSSGARRIDAPAGSTHSFPSEFPEFCFEQIWAMLEQRALSW